MVVLIVATRVYLLRHSSAPFPHHKYTRLRPNDYAVQNQTLLERDEAAIQDELESYFIYGIDRNPTACVSLREFGEVAEVAHLYVSPSHCNEGIGQKLLKFAEETACERGLNSLIALSTQAFTYFQTKAGYREGLTADLPESRRAEYEAQGRNSKILIKTLGD